MKIEISFKPKSEMRYDSTWDDYRLSADGTLRFEIAETGNPVYDRLLLIHSIIEEFLVEAKNISTEEVDQFDFNFKGEEPGDDPLCPYRDQHGIAIAVERILCAYLNMPWAVFDRFLSGGSKDEEMQAGG